MTTERTGYNRLTISVHEPFSTTARAGAAAILAKADPPDFGKYFPGGMYGVASIFLPYDVTASLPFLEGDRLVIRNGLTIVWEGKIGEIGPRVGRGATQGFVINGVGLWGALLGRITLHRNYCDMRISAAAWVVNTAATGAEKATLDRIGRLRITPKSESWANNDANTIVYTAPTGESVGRMAGTYDFDNGAKGASDYTFEAEDVTGGNNFFSLTDTASSAFDVDNPAATNDDQIRMFLKNTSGGPLTGIGDGTEYGEVTGLKVYRFQADDSTVPEPYIDNICKDVLNEVSNLNSDTTHIDTPSTQLPLEPFITNGREPINRMIERATAYGDGDGNPLYARLIHSENAASPDGKPVLECKAYPALTDYDYAIRIDEENVVSDFTILRSAINVINWVVIRYRDIDEERDIILTPDDQATLTDATSVAKWGELHPPGGAIDIGLADAATALNLGVRILAMRKDAKYYVSGPIVVQGYIRAKNGNRVPASEIEPGKRLKIENYLDDRVGVSGAGLTFYITGADVRDRGETCSIDTGVPDKLGVLLAQLKLRFA